MAFAAEFKQRPGEEPELHAEDDQQAQVAQAQSLDDGQVGGQVVVPAAGLGEVEAAQTLGGEAVALLQHPPAPVTGVSLGVRGEAGLGQQGAHPAPELALVAVEEVRQRCHFPRPRSLCRRRHRPLKSGVRFFRRAFVACARSSVARASRKFLRSYAIPMSKVVSPARSTASLAS